MVYYNGLTKAEALKALYDRASASFIPSDLTLGMAEEMLSYTNRFLTIYSKHIFVDFEDEGFDETDYDRFNGKGAAQCALDDYRKTKISVFGV